MAEIKTKSLIVFDMDETLISNTTDYLILDLFKDQNISKGFKERCKDLFWGDYMKLIYNEMEKEGITVDQIKAKVQSISLNEGFTEIIKFIKENKEKFDCIVVSGANVLFVKWVIEIHDMTDLIHSYYSYPATISEDGKKINVKNHHSHNCSVCEGSQCKSIILKEFLETEKKKNNLTYSKIAYLGDGHNDFCPSTLLAESDYLFPRIDFSLYNYLTKKNKKELLKCKIKPWKSGLDILEVLSNEFSN